MLQQISENTTGYLPKKKKMTYIYTKSYMQIFMSYFFISTQKNPNEKALQMLIRLTGETNCGNIPMVEKCLAIKMEQTFDMETIWQISNNYAKW